MDLQTFVAETLTQIVAGVQDAAKRISAMGTNAAVNPRTLYASADDPSTRTTDVEFDVALTIAGEKGERTSDQVSAAAGFLSVVSAKIAGQSANEGDARQRNETVSRVRFTVAMAQPSEVSDRRFSNERPSQGGRNIA